MDGYLQGGPTRIRKSLDVTDWTAAQAIVREMEFRAIGRRWHSIRAKARQSEPEGQLYLSTAPEPITLSGTWDKLLADLKRRNLDESTVKKYELLRDQMLQFAAARGRNYLNQFDLDTLAAFCASWPQGPRTSLKNLERLRAYFKFCEQRKWVNENPAAELKPPKLTAKPTMPFSKGEMMQILAALDKYAERTGMASAQRLRAFVLLLRYSGLRIGDAVKLSPERLNGNQLFLYTQKTGVAVYCVLPDIVAKALEACPRSSDRYFFWTGQSKLHTAVGIWQRSLKTLFRLARIAGGHAHRFRDTFAVEALLAGIPIERVSVLLGHSSVRVTEKHYAPWTLARQEQIEEDLRRAWAQDPIARGTQSVHEKSEVVN